MIESNTFDFEADLLELLAKCKLNPETDSATCSAGHFVDCGTKTPHVRDKWWLFRGGSRCIFQLCAVLFPRGPGVSRTFSHPWPTSLYVLFTTVQLCLLGKDVCIVS